MIKKTNISQSILLAFCMTSHLAFGATSPEDIYRSGSIESSGTKKSFDSYKMKKMILGGALALGTIAVLGYVYFRSGTDDNKKSDKGTSSVLKGKQEVDQQNIEALKQLLGNQDFSKVFSGSNVVDFDELRIQLSSRDADNQKQIKEWMQNVHNTKVMIYDTTLSVIMALIKAQRDLYNNPSYDYAAYLKLHPQLEKVENVRAAHGAAIDKLEQAYNAAFAARGKANCDELLKVAQKAANDFSTAWPANPTSQPNPALTPTSEPASQLKSIEERLKAIDNLIKAGLEYHKNTPKKSYKNQTKGRQKHLKAINKLEEAFKSASEDKDLELLKKAEELVEVFNKQWNPNKLIKERLEAIQQLIKEEREYHDTATNDSYSGPSNAKQNHLKAIKELEEAFKAASQDKDLELLKNAEELVAAFNKKQWHPNPAKK